MKHYFVLVTALVLPMFAAPNVAPEPAQMPEECEFQPGGLFNLPLSACGGANLAFDISSDLLSQWHALRVMEAINEQLRVGAIDIETWNTLIQRAIIVVEAVANSAIWGGANTLTNTSSVSVAISLNGSTELISFRFVDMTISALRLNKIGIGLTPALTLEISTRITNEALEKNYDLQTLYMNYSQDFSLPCFLSLDD